MGMTGAVRQLWGAAALDAMRGRLDPSLEHAVFDEIASPLVRHPEELLARLGEFVWGDLARHDEEAFAAFADRTVDHGWGRVHSVLVRLATPRILARRAPELWRRDHSHGEVEVVVVEATARLRLSSHPYLRNPVMRRFQAECFRYILSLTRVRDLRTVIGSDPDGSLVMSSTWR